MGIPEVIAYAIVGRPTEKKADVRVRPRGE